MNILHLISLYDNIHWQPWRKRSVHQGLYKFNFNLYGYCHRSSTAYRNYNAMCSISTAVLACYYGIFLILNYIGQGVPSSLVYLLVEKHSTLGRRIELPFLEPCKNDYFWVVFLESNKRFIDQMEENIIPVISIVGFSLVSAREIPLFCLIEIGQTVEIVLVFIFFQLPGSFRIPTFVIEFLQPACKNFCFF